MSNKLLLFIFLFLLVNAGLILMHLAIFRSSVPYLSWATGVIHIFLLIIFPYKATIRKTTNYDK